MSLEILLKMANALIDELARNEEKDVYIYGGSTLNLHLVLLAMLFHADGCGGEHGTRYVTAAVLACVINDDAESGDTLQMLRDLALTWVSHLLFVFKANRSHSVQHNKTPSEVATPSRDHTATLMDRGVSSTDRSGAFRDQLLDRDGYQCFATGHLDADHPIYKNRDDVNLFVLVGCHILRRAIAVFDSQSDPEAYYSAVTTFDILRNYANLPQSTIGDLESVIDDPSNGFLLDANAHTGFDRFQWCLQQTEVANKYTIKIYGNVHGIDGMTKYQTRSVEFKDKSRQFQAGKGQPSGRKRPREVPLPEPRFITIHAAITGVLHMSGAGKFLDELLGRFGDGDNSSAVRSWEELDRIVQTACIKQGLNMLAVH